MLTIKELEERIRSLESELKRYQGLYRRMAKKVRYYQAREVNKC